MNGKSNDGDLPLVEFLEKNYGKLYNAAAKYYQSHADIEDCIQSVLLKYLERFSGKPEIYPRRLAAYLITMIRNYVIDEAAKKQLTVVPAELKDCVAPGFDVEERLLASSDAAIVHRCMKKLEPDDRRILEMKYFLNMPNSEIAKSLHIQTESVRTYLSRARRKLKQLLIDNGYEGP